MATSLETRPSAPLPRPVGPGPVRRLLRRGPFWVAVGLLVAGLAVGASFLLTLPYYAFTPGQVVEVGDFIVTDAETFRPDGDLMFLTVASRQVTPFEWVEAQLDGEIDLVDRERVRPRGVSVEERRRRGLDQQAESEANAIFVALTTIGREAELSGSGALVTQIVEDSAADGNLMVDDVIVAIDGQPVGLPGDLIGVLEQKAPGDSIRLTVQRLDQEGGPDLMVDVDLVLGTHPDDDERAFVGVGLDAYELVADFGIDIDIDSQNIGGPSAGLMYTLGIIDAFTADDLTKGHRVAGTGTIRRDRTVGAIGGVRQKVFAARAAGAEYVLVPEANFEDALTAGSEDIVIVSVTTLDDALGFLDSLEPVATGA